MKTFPRFAAVATLTLVSALGAMAQSEDLQGLKVVETHPKATPSPFPLDGRGAARESLEFRTREQMTAADRELADAAQTEIAQRAGGQGFRLWGARGIVDADQVGSGGWRYEQAVCPVFPNHLILEYSRDNGQGDLSLFSAVVPRGEGHIRVIPARRRGYSLFTPSSSNALTLNDFNHMVKEGGQGVDPDWLTLGLCYGALAGGHVRAELKASTAAEEEYPMLAAPLLVVSRKGGAEVHFADTTAPPHGMDWILYFAQSGQLLKVRHKSSWDVRERPVAGNAVREAPGKPVAGAVDVGGK